MFSTLLEMPGILLTMSAITNPTITTILARVLAGTRVFDRFASPDTLSTTGFSAAAAGSSVTATVSAGAAGSSASAASVSSGSIPGRTI